LSERTPSRAGAPLASRRNARAAAGLAALALGLALSGCGRKDGQAVFITDAEGSWVTACVACADLSCSGKLALDVRGKSVTYTEMTYSDLLCATLSKTVVRRFSASLSGASPSIEGATQVDLDAVSMSITAHTDAAATGLSSRCGISDYEAEVPRDVSDTPCNRDVYDVYRIVEGRLFRAERRPTSLQSFGYDLDE
jgi:hypothetical protein